MKVALPVACAIRATLLIDVTCNRHTDIQMGAVLNAAFYKGRTGMTRGKIFLSASVTVKIRHFV